MVSPLKGLGWSQWILHIPRRSSSLACCGEVEVRHNNLMGLSCNGCPCSVSGRQVDLVITKEGLEIQ